MKKRVVLIVGIVCLLMCSCGKGIDSLEKELQKEWKNPKKVSEITLNEMADFDWDSMYSFMPYVERETVEKTVGEEKGKIP